MFKVLVLIALIVNVVGLVHATSKADIALAAFGTGALFIIFIDITFFSRSK